MIYLRYNGFMVIEIVPGFYDTAAVQSIFGWTPQQVRLTAKREHWHVTKIGHSNLYSVVDVEKYALARQRAALAARLGRRPPIPVRDSSLDVVCPVCGKFAVQWKRRTMCVNGHEHEGE